MGDGDFHQLSEKAKQIYLTERRQSGGRNSAGTWHDATRRVFVLRQ